MHHLDIIKENLSELKSVVNPIRLKMIDEVHQYQRQCLENLKTSDAIDLDLEHRYKMNVDYGRDEGLKRGGIDLDEDIYCLLYKRRKLLLIRQ